MWIGFFGLFGCLAPTSLLTEPVLLKLLSESISAKFLDKGGGGWVSSVVVGLEKMELLVG